MHKYARVPRTLKTFVNSGSYLSLFIKCKPHGIRGVNVFVAIRLMVAVGINLIVSVGISLMVSESINY